MKRDIYQEITDYIVSMLEQVDTADYQAPFARLTSSQPPRNGVTTNYYNGINTLVLWLKQQEHDYSSNEWATFQQWKEKGAMVQKGEKASSIVFYKQVEKKERSENSGDPEFYNMAKFYCVFNADQVQGYEPQTGLESGTIGTVEKLTDIENFASKTKAKITAGDMAAYHPAGDYISMPDTSLFFDNGQTATENYYGVLLHELTHWSGAKHRLERTLNGYGHGEKEDYAFEELIAELGSAFLCAQFNIKQEGRDDHAIYIKSWLKALKSNKKYIFKASAQAQKAVNYLNDLAQ